VQREGWPRIARGEHTLLLAPTGSGKTLAAFLSCIDRLTRRPPETAGVRVLYVSPLKALVYDIERNLRAPLAEMRRSARRSGRDGGPPLPRVAVRTGDTPQRERRQQARDPAEILVTTPESLFLILGSRQRETLATVETIIVDEIHALAPTKRGAHLAISLERVAAAAQADPQRIGLSATARPLGEVARFLGGDRDVGIVDARTRPRLDLGISVPVPDMTRPQAPAPGAVSASGQGAAGGAPGAAVATRSAPGRGDPEAPVERGGLWPAIYPRLLEQILAHRSTILFVNSRGLCERLSQRLNELAGEDLTRAHHGSLAHERRTAIEESLKAGDLRAIVATSSLELGIDMGAVDLVLMVESPGSVARGLQRAGRAGHRVGGVSRARIFPKHRGDLLEATVVAHDMERGAVEPLCVPRNPLDVLAQQLVSMCAVAPATPAGLEALLHRTASFRDLSREMLCGVLDMLAGRYPSTDFAELRPRLVWDREADRVEARAGAGQLALVSGGTIPDRGLYGVHLGARGPRVGELDEEMVNETRPGEVITLGASSWRVEEITRDRVVVSPAPGEVGKLPFWRGDGPGRPIELGRAIGAFVRELGGRCGVDAADDAAARGREQAERWLGAHYHLDPWAARHLVVHVLAQREATGCLPTDRAITVERFRDELGDWRICILTPLGARIHAPWALAIEALLSDPAGYEIQTLWSDDVLVLRCADAERAPDLAALLPDPDDVEERIVAQLERSSLFAAQFRENAARALLLPRRRPGTRTPLWTQRLRAQNLLAVARAFPSFPIMLETYRSCLQDVFDVPSLVELLRDVRARRIQVDEVETRQASPFARSLVFAYTATYLYQGDTPVAERRAQALTLDRQMLRDLLGQEELRDLLDAEVIGETEAELQCLASDTRADGADAVQDLLRRLGDLTPDEIAARCAGDPRPWLEELERTRRALRMKVGREERWVTAEDAGLYRDALGVRPPAGWPEAFLEAVPNPVEALFQRWARRHGPFLSVDLAERYAVVVAQVDAVLEGLVARGRLLAGDFHPHGSEREWCDPEVLRRLRRRTLARLRGEVASVDARTLARFLPHWHGVGVGHSGPGRLRAALEQLEGVPLSFAELERLVLPARVEGYEPRMLDELGSQGGVVWIGRGALGPRDGRVALYRRDRVALLAEAPETPAADSLDPRQHAVLEHLERHGACFASELLAAAGHPRDLDFQASLGDLVWRGLITNDTFAPLRTLSARRQTRAPRRGRPAAGPVVPAGRWSSVARLVAGDVDATRRAHARALLLLERYGVVGRDVLANEEWRGGFAGVYGVYREMEEGGKLRRGHFVEGLAGAQFAYAGAVDRLREFRSEAHADHTVLLAATDPANPFGALLPWPTPREPAGSPRRAVGASVVIVGGELVLYLDRAGRGVLTFPGSEPDRARLALARAAGALRRLFRQRRRRSLRIERIDGEPAARSARAATFLEAGFRADYKGLVLERSDALAASD
jgi:ATP-dependent Lhr-like helicase